MNQESSNSYTEKNGYSVSKTIGIIFVMVIVCYILYKIIAVIVPTGHLGIHHRLGKIINVLDPRVHAHIPLVDTVELLDVREQLIEKHIDCYSSEMMVVTLDVDVTYNIKRDYAEYIYKHFGTNHEIKSKMLESMLTHIIKSKISKEKALDIHKKRDEISEQIALEINKKTQRAFIYESNDGGTQYNLSDVFDSVDDVIDDNTKTESLFFGGESITCYVIESSNVYKKIAFYDSLLNVSQIRINSIDFSDEFNHKIKNIQMAERIRKNLNEKDVNP